MSRETLFATFFFVVLGFLLYQVYLVFLGFLTPAAWAAVLAIVSFPLYRWVHRRIANPTFAAAVATFLVYVAVVAPSITFSGVIINQARRFYAEIETWVRSGEAAAWVDRMEETRPVQFVLTKLPAETRNDIDLPSVALGAVQASTDKIIGSVGGLAMNILHFLTDFGMTMLILFFFLRDGEAMLFRMRELLPMESGYKDRILGKVNDMISAVVQGIAATAVAQGVLAFLGFWFLDVPFAVLLGFSTAIASVVPIAGAALVWVPATIYLLVIGAWGRGLLMLAWGAGVVGLVDNLLKPIIIGDRTKLPTLFLFLGLLGGMQAYGVIGIFLGPAVIAVLVAVLQIYRENYVRLEPMPTNVTPVEVLPPLPADAPDESPPV